jgi:hypothetical protein
MNTLQQQARFDDFVHEFNAERPHEAIAMKCPAEVYTPSSRPYRGLPDLDYPFPTTATSSSPPAAVSACIARKSIFPPSSPDSGSALRRSTREFWLVSFIDYDLGYIDLEQRTLQPLDNPFGPRLSPMS